MLAMVDHNNMDSFSKQHERNKMVDSAVNLQRSEKCKFQKNSGKACPQKPPRIVSRLQQASQTWKL